MSDKTSKKKTTKNNKASKNRKISTLRLDNGVEIPAKTTSMNYTKCFRINYIYINKIRLSDKKLYNKEHNSYKYCVFSEHDDKYILRKIILRDVVGYYNDDKDNSTYDAKYGTKTMNFKLDDGSLDKICDILSMLKKN